MNIINLKRAFNYMLENVKPEEFSMSHYLVELTAEHGFVSVGLPIFHPCNTVGCIIGKCAERFYVQRPDEYEERSFREWSEEFFSMSHTESVYTFMFDAVWADKESTATLEQALLRMKFVIDHGAEPAEYHWFDFAHVMTVQPLTPYEV